MKLILFGGVHGVGKTTLLRHLAGNFNGELYIFDPGTYFWKHLYELKDKATLEVEEVVIGELEKLKGKKTVVCNWHYAVWTEKGYIPQLCYPNLKKLVATTAPEEIVLVLVTAMAEDIYERRRADAHIRKRKIDIQCIHEEISATKTAVQEHLKALNFCKSLKLVEIDNTDLGKAKELLIKTLGYENK